jgi:hypothetical protein
MKTLFEKVLLVALGGLKISLVKCCHFNATLKWKPSAYANSL